MRILPISLVLLLVVSCASYPKKEGFTESNSSKKIVTNPYFADSSKDYVYKANIKAFKNYFGGLLIVKKLGQDEHRVVFTTEMGNTIFDFTFKNKTFQVNKVIDKLDKAFIINTLKRDLRGLTKENHIPNASYQRDGKTLVETEILQKKHYFYFESDTLVKLYRIKNIKPKVIYSYTEIADKQAKEISIAHTNINLRIDLKSLK